MLFAHYSMKIYFRLLNFAGPISRLAIPYLLYSLIGTFFGLFNFVLIIPLLNLLFGVSDLGTVQNKKASYFDLIGIFQKYLLQFDNITALKIVCITIIISVLLTNIFRYFAIRIIEFLRTEIVYRLRKTAFEKISSLHINYFTNERRGDLISRMTNDIQEVEGTISHNFSTILKEPFTLVGYFIYLFYMSPRLTLFSLIVLPLSGALIAILIKKLRESANQGQISLGVILGIIDETLSGIKVIKAFNGTNYIRKKFDSENSNYAKLMRYLAYRRELAPPFSEFMGVSLAAFILYYGGSLVLSKESSLSASEFITYIALFTQITKPAKELSQVFSKLQRGLAAGNRILEIIDIKTEIKEIDNAIVLKPFDKQIEFKNVVFSYGERDVLKNINFSLKKSKMIALVGSSGGGKSTIADLIPRFYDVKSGEILIDGVDIRNCNLESLRLQMGIVTQESILFNDTIFNNIAFGNLSATLEDVIQAAKIANAHEFIITTEDGYDTIIGDRGVKLSGGQRQRLSIARAVFKNPPILILDEATSALDTESEKLVQEALTKLMKDRTTLVIAHRLSTIQHADEILVIQNGEIVERGTHLELLENNRGFYRKLNLLQNS